MSRDMIRAEAKRIYKERVKNIPKKKRIAFADFFKQYKKLKTHKHEDKSEEVITTPEDFDFNKLVNLNDVNNSELEETE